MPSTRRTAVVALTTIATTSSGLMVSLEIETWVIAELREASCGAAGVIDGEVMVATASAEGLDLLRRNGTTWTKKRIANATEAVTLVKFADVDRDSDLDIISSGPREGSISWHENPSWTQHIIAASLGVFDILPVDIDGDLDMDCIEANFDDDRVSVYEQENDETWTHVLVNQNFPTLETVAVCAADIDGDSSLDIGAVGRDAYVAWFSFVDTEWVQQQIIGFTPLGHDALACVDVDSDSDIDFVAATTANDKILWHENVNGDASLWVEHSIADDAAAVQTIDASHDLNDDGVHDVIAANFRNNEIAWYLSSESSSFEKVVVQNDLDGARCALVADLNNDTSLDILAAGRDFGVTWSDLNLVPAPTPVPTVTPVPSVPPTEVPTGRPTSAPTAWHPYIPTPYPTTSPPSIGTSKKSAKNLDLYITMGVVGLVGLLLSCCCLRCFYWKCIEPCLFKYEPYYLPKIDLFWAKWKRTRLRNCLCFCCPPCCKSPPDEDPLHPRDGVKITPGEAPVRVVTDVPRSFVKKSTSSTKRHGALRFIKTGRREITIV